MARKDILEEGHEKKILIVDHDPVALEMLEKILVLEGYWVAKATNGLEALFIANKYKPDLIILDIVMPIVDGIEIIEQLGKNPKTKNIPALFLTSFISEKEEFKNHTENRSFLAKPIEKEKLLKEIEKSLISK
jgi:two-component system alkaline phosphatase synthesis response regulator PhoP